MRSERDLAIRVSAGQGRRELLTAIWGESEVLARQAEPERAARTKALVVTLGPSAYVELQPSGALEALAQEPGAEPDSSPLPVDQERSIRSIETWP